jgi:hypothetical protein
MTGDMQEDHTPEPRNKTEHLKTESRRVLAETESQCATALSTLAQSRQLLADAPSNSEPYDTPADPNRTISEDA